MGSSTLKGDIQHFEGKLGGGFKHVCHFLSFSPLLGEMIQFDLRICLKWVVQPSTDGPPNPWVYIFTVGCIDETKTVS